MKIKMIWDFKGHESQHFAKHHAVHLNQFLMKEKLGTWDTGFEIISELHAFAFMIIPEEHKLLIRDSLKPNRAVLA